ncbi:hypothetical protein ES703_82816 [subsurface metagenome]
MNWIKSSAFVILALACLVLITLPAPVNQRLDTLRFDPSERP